MPLAACFMLSAAWSWLHWAVCGRGRLRLDKHDSGSAQSRFHPIQKE